jgi:hypothetical protein
MVITDSTHCDHGESPPAEGWLRNDAGCRFAIAGFVEPSSAERAMATERLPMRNIREILRLKSTVKRSHRDGAQFGNQPWRRGVGGASRDAVRRDL